MAYSRCEQETSIVWDEGTKTAIIYTASPVSMRKLDRLCERFPHEYHRIWQELDGSDRVTAAKYITNCRYVRFGKPASEARKEAGRRIAAMMAERQNIEEQ